MCCQQMMNFAYNQLIKMLAIGSFHAILKRVTANCHSIGKSMMSVSKSPAVCLWPVSCLCNLLPE